MGIMCTANYLTLYFTQSKIHFLVSSIIEKILLLSIQLIAVKATSYYSKESCEREMDKTVIISGYTGELKTLIHAI